MRRVHLTILGMLLVGAVAGRGGVADEEDGPEQPVPAVSPHAPLDVGPSLPRPAADYRRTEALVTRLADLESLGGAFDAEGGSYVGFCPHAGPRAGPPAVGSPIGAACSLVALGPGSIPALLAHLSDETPTRIVTEHGGGYGGMWLGTEIEANPALSDEVAAIVSAFPGGWRDLPRLQDAGFVADGPQATFHRWTIGDVCFQILGQIVNRGYATVRFQPTNCLVLSSPARDPRIVRAIRAQWEEKDPRVELARRLMADLYTTPGGADRLAEGRLQAEAARRLAVYYPETSESLLVALLDRLDLEKGDTAAGLARNGVSLTALVRALAPVERPRIRGRVLRVGLLAGGDGYREFERAVGKAWLDRFRERVRRLLPWEIR